MARLRIEFGGTSTEVLLQDVETTVGRSNRCRIHLPDPRLADIHFRIQEKSRGYRLKDDGSGTGTRVNGKKVYATTLKHGDVIQAGGVRCTFLTREDEEEPRAARRPAPREPERGVAPPPAAKHTSLYVFSAIGVIAVAAVGYLLLRESPDEAAKLLWKEAQRCIADARTGAAREDLAAAEAVLVRIRTEYGRTRIAGAAAVALGEARRTLKTLDVLDQESERLAADKLDEPGEQEAYARLGRLKTNTHPVVVRRIANLEQKLKERRQQRLMETFRAAERKAQELIAAERYADAVRVWRDLEVGDYSLRKRGEKALVDLGKRISEEYRDRLRVAGRGDDLDARIAMLEACRPVFKGTRHADDLEVRVSALRARKIQREVVVLRQKERKKRTRPERKPKDGEAETPEPEELEPYGDPPKVAELIRRRRYGEAASMLHGISRHPDAKTRIEELTLLATLAADLVAAISGRPGEFDRIVLPHGVGRGDAVGATVRYLKVRKDGAETQYAWEDIPAKSFVRLFRQAGLDKPPRLATALFFDEEAITKEADKAYAACFRSDPDKAMLTRILARRRGIEPPDAGFELFRGRVVAPAEKDAILLGERIGKLGKLARSATASRRRAAWGELEQIGAPAVDVLAAALRERRKQSGAELKASSAFTPARFAARYGKELRSRREDALRFILDKAKYPYPNKSDAAQKEAERRVDRVRELYERPFDMLLRVSDKAQILDQELRELDERLARVDPLGMPHHETVVDEITKRLDMRMVAIDDRDKKRIARNIQIEQYNRDLKGTTADAEERANVTAVNEYRWMMGLHAVKIDERLVRAARKHSIEMKQLEYFEHDSPTPHLKTPGQRAKREGYGGSISENIARGASNGRDAFWQWFRSSGHHRNMLIAGHTDLGCGSCSHHWWTQNFGRVTGRSLNPPNVPPDPDPPGQSGNGRPPPG